MKIIPVTYKWAFGLVHRKGAPPHIIWHHAAVKSLTPQACHAYDVKVNGWSGMGYHYFVRKDGKIYRGRPEWAMGAHARGFNDSLGVCAEGAYHVETAMPKAQLRALQELHDYLHGKYPRISDLKHSDVNATQCPGRFYPYKRVVAGVPGPVTIELPVPKNKPKWWGDMLAWLKRQKKPS